MFYQGRLFIERKVKKFRSYKTKQTQTNNICLLLFCKKTKTQQAAQ